MKVLMWAVTAVLAIVWTLGAWAVAGVLGWAAGQSAGDTAELARVVGGWTLPSWVTWWVDPGFVSAVLGGIVWSIEQLQSAWPWIGAALGWLVPLTWIAWGVGLATLLVLALVGQWLIGRLQAPATPPVRAA